MKICFVIAMSLLFLASDAQLKPDTLAVKTLADVVVTASKTKEYILTAPVSIQMLSRKDIKLSTALSFFDAMENVQGAQIITPGMGFKIINARGFSNTTNVRFAQLVDGMDVASPHIGAPVGNALGPGDLDINKAEMLAGIASALYGMNGSNGLVNFITKDPFAFQGLSIQQKTAVTHLGDADSDAKLFSETSLRWAKVWNNKFALKFNAACTKGYDWIANNHTDLNPKANESSGLVGCDNPAYDAANSYGNESSDRKTITLGGKSYVVSRTGYDEKDLLDYTINNIRADAGLYYRITPGATLSYSYRFAKLDNVYQRANRFKLDNYFVQQHGLQYLSKVINAKVYLNNENTGDSYNMRSMGENIDRNYKPDTKWYVDYTNGYNTAIAGGMNVANAHRQARTAADNGRYQPGTVAFVATLDKLQQINNWDSGAALKVKQSFLHSELQVNLTESLFTSLKKYNFEIFAGIDNRTYYIMPDGNYFINPDKSKASLSNYRYGKTGAYLSVSKKLLDGKLKPAIIIRSDKNDYYSLEWNSRFTAVYSPQSKFSIRVAYQSAFRFPVTFEAFSNINSGGVKRQGGLPVMSNGIFENAYLATSINTFQAAVLNAMNLNGLTKTQAIQKNSNLLKKNPYTYMQPEHVNSFEAGFRGAFWENKLLIDADVYFNRYTNFIAQANINVPNTQNPDSIPLYLYDKKQLQYRMYTNSQTAIKTYGSSLGLTCKFLKDFTAKANTTFTKIFNLENEDGLEDGFNTPQWIVNLSLAKQHIIKNLDAAINFKWQDGYDYTSFLSTGYVPAYFSVDAQVTYNLAAYNSSIKAGATNLTNNYYTSILGGPSIGGMYYLTIAYGIK